MLESLRKNNLKSLFVIVSTLVVLSLVPILFVNAQIVDPSCVDVNSCDFKALVSTINNLVRFVIGVAAAFVAGSIAYAGWLYLSSQGDSGKIGQAKKVIITSIVGFLVVLLAWLIVTVLLGTLASNDAKNVFQEIFGQLKGI